MNPSKTVPLRRFQVPGRGESIGVLLLGEVVVSQIDTVYGGV